MLVAGGPVNSGAVFDVPGAVAASSPRFAGFYRLIFIVFSTLGFLVLALQLGLTAVMAGRVLPGVTVAGMEIGGMTRSQAREVLARPLQNHTINLKVGSASYSTAANAIADYDLNGTVAQALAANRGHPFAPMQFLAARKSQPLSYVYHRDRSGEEAFIAKVISGTGQAPVDAAIIFNDGVPLVKPDADGRAISRQAVKQAIASRLDNLSSYPVQLEPGVQHARIREKDARSAIEPTNQLLAVPVTITYQDKVFQPTAAQKSQWISFQKTPEAAAPGLTPTISKDGIKHYLQSLAIQINVNPVNRKIHIQNGDSRETQAGQDGLQLDQESLAALIAGGVGAKTPVVAAAPTKKVPFQTEYNRTVSLDYGKYIEVNLSLQRLWVYQDHNVIHEAPLTSGARAYPTVTGLFSIQAKQTNRNLNGYAIGYNYNVFVKYWMPFYGNFGMHDASWRNGSFGGQDYITNGSHGCVNLPEATAAFIFGWADVGTPVWVHH